MTSALRSTSEKGSTLHIHDIHGGSGRRGSRIQKRGGGGSYIQKGGGGRTGISGADPNCCRVLGKSTSKKKLQTAVGGGGGSDHPPKKSVSAHGSGTLLHTHLVIINLNQKHSK